MQCMFLVYQMWEKTQNHLSVRMLHSFFFFFKGETTYKAMWEQYLFIFFLNVTNSFRTPINVHLRECKTN